MKWSNPSRWPSRLTDAFRLNLIIRNSVAFTAIVGSVDEVFSLIVFAHFANRLAERNPSEPKAAR
jgi:hypothetical protein